MTAINAVRTKDEVLIFTDGAEYDRECVITQFRSKLFVSPHLPLVMSSRGPVGAIETLAAELERRATSFEDVLRWLRSPMARAMAEIHTLESSDRPSLRRAYCRRWDRTRVAGFVQFGAVQIAGPGAAARRAGALA